MLIRPLARAACRPGLRTLRACPISPIARVYATSPIHRKDAQDQRILSEKVVSNKEQRRVDWEIIKDMSRYLWPKDNLGTRARVGLSVGLLVGAKLLNVQIPFYFKSIVDSMNIDFMAVGGTAWTVAGSMIVTCKLSSSPSKTVLAMTETIRRLDAHWCHCIPRTSKRRLRQCSPKGHSQGRL